MQKKKYHLNSPGRRLQEPGSFATTPPVEPEQTDGLAAEVKQELPPENFADVAKQKLRLNREAESIRDGQTQCGSVPECPGMMQQFKLNGRDAMIIAVLIVVAPALALALNPISAIPAAIFAVAVSGTLVSLCRGLQVKWVIKNAIALVVSAALLMVILFIGYTGWYNSFMEFSGRVDELSTKFDQRVLAAQERVGNLHTDDVGENIGAISTMVAEWNVNTHEIMVQALDKGADFLRVGSDTLTLAWLQSIMFALALIFSPVLLMALTPGLGRPPPPEGGGGGFFGWICPKLLYFNECLCDIGFVRFTKALLIFITCYVGLTFSGLSGLWFIGATAFCIALVSNLSGLALIVLGALMVGYGRLPWWQGAIGLAVTVALSIMVEYKLHWYFFMLPVARKRNLPPEMLGAGRSSLGRLFSFLPAVAGKALSYIPSIISVCIFIVLCWGVWQIYDVYAENAAREKIMAEADQLYQNHEFAAAGDMLAALCEGEDEEVRKHHPGDVLVLDKLLLYRVKHEKDVGKLMDLADRIAAWDSTEFMPKSPHLKLRYKIAGFIVAGDVGMLSPEQGYKTILNEPEVFLRLDASALREIAAKFEKSEDDSHWAFLPNARASFLEAKFAEAIEKANKGLDKFPDNEMLLEIIDQALARRRSAPDDSTQ